MNVKNKKIFYLVFILFLLFLKIDFRITNDLVCCGDDYDYFSHAETIVEDFDFNYDNQLPNKSRYYSYNKNAPFGFVGSGILSAPFMYLGILLDKLFNTTYSFQNFKYLMYSFSSIFYLLLTLIIVEKILLFYDKRINYVLYIFGSGLIYYAFERYSMTHVYEVFTIFLTIYFSVLFIDSKKNQNIYLYLLPFATLLMILVRWTNFYFAFIPLFLIINGSKELPRIRFKNYFVIFISSVINLYFFISLSKSIYGTITFSPSYVYMTGKYDEYFSSLSISDLPLLIINFASDIILILFTNEFGIFWLSPIIFVGFILSILNVFISNNLKQFLFWTYMLMTYVTTFYIVSVWKSTAASYGFRYLYCLIPVSIIVLIKNDFIKFNSVVYRYLNIFSIFSLFSVLFFETTLYSQLSTVDVLNSFGELRVYSQPEYVTGYIRSIISIDSYLKILATSYLGVFIMYVSFSVFGFENVKSFLLQISNNNDDLNLLISKLNTLDFEYFLTIFLIALFSSRAVYKKLIFTPQI